MVSLFRGRQDPAQPEVHPASRPEREERLEQARRPARPVARPVRPVARPVRPVPRPLRPVPRPVWPVPHPLRPVPRLVRQAGCSSGELSAV